jgi:hypothetical protein
MMPTFKEVEAALAAQAEQHDLEEQARSAVWMVGILVQKLGGEVTIDQTDFATIQGFQLVRIEDLETMSLTLRLQRAHPDV